MKAATKPSRKQAAPTVEMQTLDSYRDLATKGSSQIAMMTVRDYLTRLGLFDGTVVSEMRPEVAATFQRGILNINTNAIKQRMFSDLLRGGTLPPLVVYDDENTWKIIDGLQRSSVIVEALKTILALESQTKPQPFAQKRIEAILQLKQTIISSEEFLARPVIIQIWTGLLPDELIRLFIVLNAGQQKVNPRHLLEVIQSELRKMFEEWGLPISTKKEETESPRPRGRRSKADQEETSNVEKVQSFRFEYLINGIIAYTSRDSQVKTSSSLDDEIKNSQTVHDDDTILNKRITDIGSELCQFDFKWVCIELNNIIQEKYKSKKDNPLLSDVFFIPTIAALGWARQEPTIAEHVESRQAELIKLLITSTSSDPLVLNSPTIGFNNITNDIKTSIGRTKRKVVYNAWERFYRNGITNTNYPIDWQMGKNTL